MTVVNSHAQHGGGRQRSIIYLSPLIGISLLSMYFNRAWLQGVDVSPDNVYDKPIPEVRKTTHKPAFPELESAFNVEIPEVETSQEASSEESPSGDSEEDSSSDDSEEDSSNENTEEGTTQDDSNEDSSTGDSEDDSSTEGSEEEKAPAQVTVKTDIDAPGDEEAFSSSCSYREYPWPDHHTGLPYLGDVFASHDAQWVYFIGTNRGKCDPQYKKSDAFAADKGVGHRFMCVFPDSVHVLSEFVQPSTTHDTGYIFRCRIPKQFQHHVNKPQESTTLHIDLHAMNDLELKKESSAKIQRFPSMEVSEMPRLARLPICHPIDRTMEPKQHNMTAFVRMKSSYALSHRKKGAKKQISPLPRLIEWMDYHRQQGFDHFVVYDNDPEPHGPIESMLQPMVKAGLASYRWFPLGFCYNKKRGGARIQYGQMVASLSALHRYGFASEWYAHMDVDEFFIPLQKDTTVLEIAQKTDPKIDSLLWTPNRMAPCNGANVTADESILAKWKCLTGKHFAASKIIMRTDRMLYFFIHYAHLTVDWEKPNSHRMNDKSEGLLAHYRQSETQRWWRDSYTGKVKNEFDNEVGFMDHFLETRSSMSLPTAKKSDEKAPVIRHTNATLHPTECPSDLTEEQCKAMVPPHMGYKKVLVTGGAGFIGSHVAEYLLERGDDVVIIDEMNDHYDVRIKEANLKLLRDKYPSYERLTIYRGDICDKDFVEAVFAAEKPSWVCHMAARAGVRPSIQNPYIYVHSNIEGTIRLMEVSHKHKVKNFVFASSSSVYGGSNSTYFSESENVDHPISPYAASKKAAELISYTYHHLYGLNITALRFFTVYGPRGRPDMAPFIFVDRVSQGGTIDQFGDGTTSRDYTYISDIVDGIVRCIDRPHKYEVFNLGKGSGTSLKEFIQIVEKYTGKKANINQKPDQPGDVPYTNADVTKPHTMLGYQAKVPFDEGIRRTVEWYNETYMAMR